MRYGNQVSGFSKYLVFPDGQVYSLKTHKVLKPMPDKRGYFQYALYDDDGKRVWWKAHRLIATVYVNNEYFCNHVHHYDNDPANNCYLNLEWVTRRENNLFVRDLIANRWMAKQEELEFEREADRDEMERRFYESLKAI
jgi:hypothetical protein